MPSWKVPVLINKLVDDIPALKGLLTDLLKWTDSGTTDVPVGAKRIQNVSGGIQIQEYSGSAWPSIGRLMHDVDMVDGKHADTGTAPDTVPVRDANGKLPGDIAGNAPTASSATGLAPSYVVPIDKGGTGATSEANARVSLGLNNASNINSGVLSASHGGTGRTDGKAAGIHLVDYGLDATAIGQLGPAATKSGVSANTLVKAGVYLCTGCTIALNYPTTEDCFIRVCASKAIQKTVDNVPRTYTYVAQTLTETSGEKQYHRESLDGGETWSGWAQAETIQVQDVHLYVSKGGSDANTGLLANNALLTVGALLDTLLAMKTLGAATVHFGPGEWGSLSINGKLLQAKSLRITNYPDTQAGTMPIVAEGETVPEGTYFEDLADDGNFGNEPPHFDGISASSVAVSFGNVSADAFIFENADASFTGAVSFCSMSAYRSGVRLVSHVVRKSEGVTAPVFALDGSHLGISCGASLCKMLNEPLNAQFLTCRNSCSLELNPAVNWNGVFAGQKFMFDSPVVVHGEATPDLLPGTAGEGSWFSQKAVHVHDGTSALGDVSVAVGASAVTGSLSALNTTSSDATSAVISLVHQTDGTKYATAPTPPNGDSSDKIATTEWAALNSFPAGTRMFFQQSAAPSGWTKETGSGYNDIALRLITGDIANKTNGKAFTTCMAASRYLTKVTQGGSTGNGTNTGSIGNKALSVAMLAKHSHNYKIGPSSGSYGAPLTLGTGTVKFSSTGSGSNHNHSWTGTAHNHTFTGQEHDHYLHLDINYIDFIVAAKA